MKRPDIMAPLAGLARDEKGTSILELAFVAPLVAALILGAADYAMMFAKKLQLEQAAQRSVEMATAYGKIGSDYTYIANEAASAAGEPIESVTLVTWLECAGVKQQSFYAACPDAADQIARYLKVEIEGGYAPIFPAGPTIFKVENGEIPLAGNATVRLQ